MDCLEANPCGAEVLTPDQLEIINSEIHRQLEGPFVATLGGWGDLLLLKIIAGRVVLKVLPFCHRLEDHQMLRCPGSRLNRARHLAAVGV